MDLGRIFVECPDHCVAVWTGKAPETRNGGGKLNAMAARVVSGFVGRQALLPPQGQSIMKSRVAPFLVKARVSSRGDLGPSRCQ